MIAAKYTGKEPSDVRIGARAIQPNEVIAEPESLVKKLLRYPGFEEVEVVTKKAALKPKSKRKPTTIKPEPSLDQED